MNFFYDPVASSYGTAAIAKDVDAASFVALSASSPVAPATFAESRAQLVTGLQHMLFSHHGRDKLFKVVQYSLRCYLWATGINVVSHFVQDATTATGAQPRFSDAERTLMTIINTRRMFKVGRFIAEFSRAGTTLTRVAALAELANSGVEQQGRTFVALQLQMVADIIGRLIMCCKSVLDDVCWASRKGFFHEAIEQRYQHLAMVLGVPVLMIDLVLSSARLAQGVVDARMHGAASRGDGFPLSSLAANTAGNGAGCSNGGAGGFPIDHAPSSTATAMRRRPSEASPDLGQVADTERVSFSLLTAYDELGRAQSQLQHGGGPSSAAASRRQSTMARPAPTIAAYHVSCSACQSPATDGHSRALFPVVPVGEGLVSPAGGTSPVPTSSPLTAAGPGALAAASTSSSSMELNSAAVTPRPTTVRYQSRVHSLMALLWRDDDLRWASLFHIKLLLDLTVVLLLLFKSTSRRAQGVMSLCGLLSALISVRRVWNTGK